MRDILGLGFKVQASGVYGLGFRPKSRGNISGLYKVWGLGFTA